MFRPLLFQLRLFIAEVHGVQSTEYCKPFRRQVLVVASSSPATPPSQDDLHFAMPIIRDMIRRRLL